MANARAESAAPTELLFFVSVFTQGFISGFALIPPWALQECRAYGTHASTNQSNKRKHRHRTINPTTSASNNTNQ